MATDHVGILGMGKEGGASSLPTGIGVYPHTQAFFQERKKEVMFYKFQCLATRFTEPDNELFIPQSKQYRSVSEQSTTTSQGMHMYTNTIVKNL